MKIFATFGLLCCFAGSVNVIAATPEVDPLRLRTQQSHTLKPTLPVSIATQLPERIVAGENVTLDVKLSSALEQGELRVLFTPDEGLAMVSPQQELQFTLPGGVFRTTIPLTVVPSRDGRYSVSVDIRHVVDGRVRGVARGITFRVGDEPAAATKSAAAQHTSGGENVVSMPAKETIVRKPR